MGVRQVDDTIPIAGSKRTDFAFPETYDHSKIPLEDEEVPVAIIGSSMVGMFAGLLLGYHGIHSVSFDRHPSTAIHPRAALFLLRSVEILRQLGLDEIFSKESEKMFDLNAGMLIVEKLYKGKVIARLQESDPAKTAQVTPCSRLWLTQNMFEPLLRSNAKKYDAEQRFGETVIFYEEVEDGVIIVVENTHTKAVKKYKTRYLIACDGNRSATRQKENIDWHGPGYISNNISINFRANLAPYLGERAVHGTTYVINKDINAGFRLEQAGQAGFMIVGSAKGREGGFAPDSVSEQEAKQFFKDATGIEDEKVDLQIDSISYWSVAAYSADRMTSKGGKVFIMGDAAHVMPPTGGMGGNTGVADAYNLAWKLAFVLKGWSSPALLSTYDDERVPGSRFFVEQAFSRLVNRVYHGKGYDFQKEIPDIRCEIGYRYTKGGLSSRSEDSQEDTEDPFDPMVIAGSRLPHVSLQGQGIASTLDLIKQNLVLIMTDANSPWLAAAKSQKIPIDTWVLDGNSSLVRVDSGKAGQSLKLSIGEALLVRPDGYIAWRAPADVEEHQEQLRIAIASALAVIE